MLLWRSSKFSLRSPGKSTNRSGVELEFINLGGGIGIPYLLEDDSFDIDGFAAGVQTLLQITPQLPTGVVYGMRADM